MTHFFIVQLEVMGQLVCVVHQGNFQQEAKSPPAQTLFPKLVQCQQCHLVCILFEVPQVSLMCGSVGNHSKLALWCRFHPTVGCLMGEEGLDMLSGWSRIGVPWKHKHPQLRDPEAGYGPSYALLAQNLLQISIS